MMGYIFLSVACIAIVGSLVTELFYRRDYDILQIGETWFHKDGNRHIDEIAAININRVNDTITFTLIDHFRRTAEFTKGGYYPAEMVKKTKKGHRRVAGSNLELLDVEYCPRCIIYTMRGKWSAFTRPDYLSKFPFLEEVMRRWF